MNSARPACLEAAGYALGLSRAERTPASIVAF
jgi:hypothetical protein